MTYFHWANFSFLVYSHFLTLLSPGPTTALVLDNAILSRKKGMQATIGVCIGSFFTKALSLLGISLFFKQYPWVQPTIQLAGGAYLCVFGALSLKKALQGYQTHTLKTEVGGTVTALSEPVQKTTSPIVAGFLVNISNPLSVGVFLVMFSTLVTPDTPLSIQFFYVLVTVVMSFAYFFFLVEFLAIRQVQNVLAKYRFVLNFMIGSVMLFWGFKSFYLTLL